MTIESVEILSPNIASQASFYGDMLGFRVEVDRDGSGLTVFVGSSKLIFRESFEIVGRHHFAFQIPAEVVDSAEQFLRGRGITPISDSSGQTVHQFESWGARSVYFSDFDGNVLEFIGRPTPGGHDANFTINAVKSICEIGLAYLGPVAMAAEILSRLGIETYRDSSATFIPLGDEKGLLIVVKSGRVWYPTEATIADEVPVTIHVRVADGRRFCISNLPLRIAEAPKSP